MNGQEYENGYFRGHTTTPDERAGARAAAADRFEKENAEAWKRHADETALRAEEDARRVQQMQADAYEQKRREELALAQKKEKVQHAQQSGKPAPDDGEWSTSAAVLGFIISAIWATGHFQDAEDSTLMIIIAGVLGGVILGRLYQAILGIAVVIFILMALAGGL